MITEGLFLLNFEVWGQRTLDFSSGFKSHQEVKKEK
jgi:hypothetical protein